MISSTLFQFSLTITTVIVILLDSFICVQAFGTKHQQQHQRQIATATTRAFHRPSLGALWAAERNDSDLSTSVLPTPLLINNNNNTANAPWFTALTTDDDKATSTKQTTKKNDKQTVAKTPDVFTRSFSVDVEDVYLAPLKESQYMDLQLTDHKPLGCTLEESLVDECPHVFVSKIVPEGAADRAGLKVGDVLLAVSDIFGTRTPVVGRGLELVTGYILSRPSSEVLEMRIARGTTVLAEHERVLVDLCSTNSGGHSSVSMAQEARLEKALVNYLREGYANEMNFDKTKDQATKKTTTLEDDDAGVALLDQVINAWNEDDFAVVPLVEPGNPQNKRGPKANIPTKVKPWSSRSSPSGTFVRDPVTGQMKRIA